MTDLADTRRALEDGIHAAVDEFHHLAGQQLPEGVEHWPSESVLLALAEAHALAVHDATVLAAVHDLKVTYPRKPSEVVALRERLEKGKE